MTKEEMIELAKQAGFERLGHTAEDWVCHFEDIEEFTKLVAEHERKVCAEICDGFYLTWIDTQGRSEFMGEGASECAGAIRARGKND